MGMPPSIATILSKVNDACVQILAMQSSQVRPRAQLNYAVMRAVTSSPLAQPRSFRRTTTAAYDFSAVGTSLDEITTFVGTMGVITDDDKASVLLRALMPDILYHTLAEYVEVTAPNITFDKLVRLARTKNNNSQVQEDGAANRRQASYSAGGYCAPGADTPLKYCKHHG